jgi:hypothetical protein
MGIAEPKDVGLFSGAHVVRPEPLDSARIAKRETFDRYPRSSRFGKRQNYGHHSCFANPVEVLYVS